MGTPHRLRAGLVGTLTLAAVLLAACASPGTGIAASGVPATVDPRCTERTPTPAVPPATPTGAAVITVDDQVNYWRQNGHTAPLGLAVYSDGTVIRAEGDGAVADLLPAMVIGRIDACAVPAAAAALTALADADFGMPEITDQGVTTVTVTRPDAAPVVLSAYALGIGDEYVDPGPAAARAELTSLVEGLAGAPAEVSSWTPDRIRITRFDDRSGLDAADPGRPWPLARPIDGVLRQTDRRLPCGVLDGAEAAALIAALAGGPVLSTWTDGDDSAELAIAALVPGQPACDG